MLLLFVDYVFTYLVSGDNYFHFFFRSVLEDDKNKRKTRRFSIVSFDSKQKMHFFTFSRDKQSHGNHDGCVFFFLDMKIE